LVRFARNDAGWVIGSAATLSLAVSPALAQAAAPATFVLLRLVGPVFPLRASAEDKVVGLDISLHGEALQ
jgi:ammonia channel protein AmtB